jgi:hypothetical protein
MRSRSRARGRIGEHPRAERLAIERAVGREDVGAEPHQQLGQRRLPRHHHRARELIGVDDRGAAGAQERRHRALAAGDPTGEPQDLGHMIWYHGGRSTVDGGAKRRRDRGPTDGVAVG